MTRVAMLLWLGEMRVQRILSRNRLIAAVQISVMSTILVFLAVRVHQAVDAGVLAITNISVLSAVGVFIIFANVIVTGEESKARVQDIRDWVRSLPVSTGQLRGLLAAMGLLRGALFTATVIGIAAVGAFIARDSWGSRLEIVASALILPLLPVSAGLWFGARRSGPVPRSLTTVPMAVSMLTIAVPFPAAHGFLLTLLHIIAAPALVLIGAASPATAAGVLVFWTAGAGWFLSRLDRAIEVSAADGRPRLASLLATGPNARRIAADVVVHQLRPRDVAEAVLPAGLLGAVALLMLAQTTGSSVSAAAVTVAALALPATVAGYRQVGVSTALEPATEEWIRSLPLGRGALPWARHVTATVAATVAATVLAAVIAAANVAGLPLVCIVVIVLTPLSLTGWIAFALNTKGIRRVLLYLGLGLLIGTRLITTAVLTVTVWPPLVGAVLVPADLMIGLLGHLIMRHRVRGM
jgi:hypothetical protein